MGADQFINPILHLPSSTPLYYPFLYRVVNVTFEELIAAGGPDGDRLLMCSQRADLCELLPEMLNHPLYSMVSFILGFVSEMFRLAHWQNYCLKSMRAVLEAPATVVTSSDQ